MSVVWAVGYADLTAAGGAALLHGLRRFAAARTLTLVGLYTDTADSHGSEFAALTATLERGGVSHLILPSMDHLDRGRAGTGWMVRHVLRSHFGVEVHELAPATDLARTG